MFEQKFYKSSVDGTYGVGFILQATCGHGFILEGPRREACTASGNWQQPFYDDNYVPDYSDPRRCIPGNTSNILLKLLII